MSIDFVLAATADGIGRARLTAGKQWEVDFLLPGQDVRCLAPDPLNANRIYAGTQGSGVLRSDDRGQSWQSDGLDGQIVKALAVSPLESGTIYAGLRPARIFVRRGDRQDWSELESFRQIKGRRLWFSPAEPPFSAYVQGIGLSPTDPQVVVVGVEFGAVVRSHDGGKTWSGHRQGALRDCHSLTFHATSGDHVYEAGGTGAGAACSLDGGITWIQSRTGLDRHYGWACAADPQNPDVWYASIAPGPRGLGPPQAHIDGAAMAHIFRSMDGGTWEKLSGGLPQPLDYMAYALVTHKDAPGHLYAGLSNGDIWHTTDYGDSWTQLSLNLRRIRTMIVL